MKRYLWEKLMIAKVFSISTAIYLTLVTSISFGQDKEIIVILNDGKQLNGQLLSVRDSALVLSGDGLHFNLVHAPDIQTLTIKGTSNYPLWIGLGALVGVASGAVIGSEIAIFDHSYGATIGGLVGVGTGVLVGVIVANAKKDEDITIVHPTSNDLSSLKQLSHFPDQEPEYLKQLK